MTLEAALLSALTVVSGCLSWAVKALYERLISAERTVVELQAKIQELVKDAADKGAKLEMVKQCQQKECPFFLMFRKHES
jgi:cell division protein FtsB